MPSERTNSLQTAFCRQTDLLKPTFFIISDKLLCKNQKSKITGSYQKNRNHPPSFPRKRESRPGNRRNLSEKPKLENNGQNSRLRRNDGSYITQKKLKPNSWDSLLREADRCRLKDFQTA
ncbi:TPA: hypothetical protein ACE6QH_001561 [Neisseria gonorrhoeae]